MRHNEILTSLQNLTNEKITQQKIADALGLNLGTISARAARNSNYDTMEVAKIGQKFGVSLLKSDVISSLANTTDMQEIITDDIVVDYYPEVFGSCGTGVFVPAEYKERMSVPRKFFSSYSPLKHYSVINAFGDSMMPYIQDKDKLLVEHFQLGEQIRDNRVYVFRLGEKIFCKRLVDNLNHIVIKSDNTMYEPMRIEYSQAEEDMQIIGRIVGMIRDMD